MPQEAYVGALRDALTVVCLQDQRAGGAGDVGELQRKRELLVEALTGMGFRVRRPEGAFYLFVHTPADDDELFAAALAELDVFVLPGTLFETPGYFRISLTASEDMILRALPVVAAAIQDRK